MVLSDTLKTDYIRWYKLAEKLIQNESLIPKRSEEEIVKNCIHFRHDGPWMMFMPRDETKDTMKSMDKPNVYLFIDGNELDLGVTFQSAPATDRFENIVHSLHSKEKEELKEKLKRLPANYNTAVEKKIKKKYYAEPPQYEIVLSSPSNEVGDKKFEELVEKINEIRENGRLKTIGAGNYPSETPSLNLASLRITRDEAKFKGAIINLFDVLKTCLEIKTGAGLKDLQILKLIEEAGWSPEELKSQSDYRALQDNIVYKHHKEVPIQTLKRAVKNCLSEKQGDIE